MAVGRVIRAKANHPSTGMTVRELEEYLADIRRGGASDYDVPTFLCKIGFGVDGTPAKTVTWDSARGDGTRDL